MSEGDTGTLLCNASAPFTEDDLRWVKLSLSNQSSFDGDGTGAVCRSFDIEGTSGSGSGSGLGGSGSGFGASDGNDIVNDFELVATGSVLNFTSVMFGDEGAYVCLVGSTDCYIGAPVIGQSNLMIE